jgi:hypothetical protein
MKNGTGKFKIRIVGFSKKAAAKFRFHPLNWRRHGDDQREALRMMLGDVGWVQGVIENQRTGNLIDGHARIEEALRDDPAQPVPYIKVDLSEAEEKAVLATLDPIGAMAEVDPAAVDLLFQQTIADMPALEQLLTMLHRPAEETDQDQEEHAARLLTERFIVPPFTVLDARQGYWQDRKAAWLAIGIQSELGRGDTPSTSARSEEPSYRQIRARATATPGGSLMPAANYKNRKRGDGRGREI